AEDIDCLEDLYKLIDDTIVDDPPITIKEGGLIKEGYSETIDMLRGSKSSGKEWLARIEETEREATGIKNLKIKFNKVFGYYIEITNSFKDKVPERYIRKQTLVNAERYITEELKELEDTILGAEEKLFSLEYNIFTDIRDQVAAQVQRIQKTASAISSLDAFCSLAYVAEHNNFVRPEINTKGIVDIKAGRHPVVELMGDYGTFISNDSYADTGDNRVSIITGPNMAGKSTYMRQVALIVLMSCIGSYVPAESASVCVCDRIFTRVGASDDLASGQSTFMVEMTEVANILRNATSKSLVILDEIGRGTSTYDGLSIAWAVVEYIANKRKCGAKTLFSTHYHELTELEGQIDGVKNYCITVKEQGDNIIFLRKIVRGGADKSYGIQVAALAGVPREITDRAKDIVNMLVNADVTSKQENVYNPHLAEEIKAAEDTEYPYSDVIDKIKALKPDSISPLEALNFIYDLKNSIDQ
ncbi:MAG: DNA mismatch repair protein MutS, partial [Parasporobacterium sp.]|nr:DNA mismatch repair protein MutS [Parasporobacterium sp.]